jgi:UDP-N-acetylmuramoylalanine--D-glutamate ligase
VITWADLPGKRVGVWGLGREGQANLRKLRSLGIEPVLVDDHPAEAGVLATGERGVLATGEGGLDALTGCDVVLKTPGISPYRDEVSSLTNAVLTSGLSLWLAEQDLGRVVCVTGTKGKSTTASVIAHLLNGLGHSAAIAGNIGKAPYADDTKADFWVIEVSSYQAKDLQCAPPVVAVTSLHPDHLDWHRTVEQYYQDKLSLCTKPGAELTIANGDSQLLRDWRPSLGPTVEWVCASDEPAADWMGPLGLRGEHNRRNALIARRCLQALGVVGNSGDSDDDRLRAAARGYQGLPSRLATAAVIDGVTFIDDSLSTNVLPTLAALDAFPEERTALIVGGHDRGIDYGPLAVGIASRQAPTLVLTLPDSGPRIRAAIEAAGHEAVRDCAGLADAVQAGAAWARPDGIVLLSPAAPSFGQFKDYRDRAEAFAKAVREL